MLFVQEVIGDMLALVLALGKVLPKMLAQVTQDKFRPYSRVKGISPVRRFTLKNIRSRVGVGLSRARASLIWSVCFPLSCSDLI